MNILYEIDKNLYVNLTNKCPCNCIFCIRNESDEVSNSGSLWLDHEPNTCEIKAEFEKVNLDKYDEVVFCGYGEPLYRINEVIEISEFIKSRKNIKIRINTNGLSDLIHKKDTASMLKDIVDSVSISLNAPNKEKYTYITRPKFGDVSFDSMINFAKKCKENIGEVVFSVVDEISESEIRESKNLSEFLGIPLKIRHKQ